MCMSFKTFSPKETYLSILFPKNYLKYYLMFPLLHSFSKYLLICLLHVKHHFELCKSNMKKLNVLSALWSLGPS